MLQLSGSLLNRQVLSLRSGGVVATTQSAIINPTNLKIEGFYCIDAFDHKKTTVLLYQDIRDTIAQGFVVNDQDVLVDPSELVRLKDIMDLQFSLLNKRVVTVSKQKVGKVTDFATEIETMYIQKLYVAQGGFKSLTGGSLSVNRDQIVDISDHVIVIHDLEDRLRARAGVPA